MNSARPRHTAWTLLIGVLLCTLLPVGGVVLCFGVDGHFNVAVAMDESQGCPCEQPGPAESEPDESEHGPCQDLGLTSPELCDTRASWDAVPPLLALVPRTEELLPAIDVAPRRAALRPPRSGLPPPRLDHLRTVVLRS